MFLFVKKIWNLEQSPDVKIKVNLFIFIILKYIFFSSCPIDLFFIYFYFISWWGLIKLMSLQHCYATIDSGNRLVALNCILLEYNDVQTSICGHTLSRKTVNNNWTHVYSLFIKKYNYTVDWLIINKVYLVCWAHTQ